MSTVIRQAETCSNRRMLFYPSQREGFQLAYFLDWVSGNGTIEVSYLF